MKRIFFFALAIGLFACQRDAEELPPPPKQNNDLIAKGDTLSNKDDLKWVALTKDYFVTEEDAKNTALSFAQNMRTTTEPTHGVRFLTKGEPLEIESIRLVKRISHTTTFRSVGNFPQDIYIVNFKKNKGYVLTSADNRVPEVFAYNDTGHWGDTLNNPIQALLYERILDYVELKRELFEKERKQLTQEAWADLMQGYSQREKDSLYKLFFDEEGEPKIIGAVNTSYPTPSDPKDSHKDKDDDPNTCRGYIETAEGQWKTIHDTGVILKTEWAQSIGGYNALTPIRCGENAPVGCVAVAVGQIMAYHKKPAIFEGRTMHWEEMTRVKSIKGVSDIAKGDIQYLLRFLGKENLLNMEYLCGKSGAYDKDALSTFKQLGFSQAKLVDVKGNTLKLTSNLEERKPTYISGQAKNLNLGHAWIVDGFIEKEKMMYRRIHFRCKVKDTKWTERDRFVHHNLGWGSNNAWYNIALLSYSSESINLSNLSPKDFTYSMKMIIDIK